MKKSYLQLLRAKGLSIIPCTVDKRPVGAWKKYQTTARSEKEIEDLEAPLYGIVMGYGYLETIDIDLKVLSTAKEQKEWWDEYLSFLQDNILDFDEKFVIKKTLNNGFHIIYKSKRVQGNTKIASLKGHNEAIIESRGEGGMIIAYDRTLGKLNYQDIQFISDEDRAILWSISETYNYIEPQGVNIPKKELIKHEAKPGDITPWEDFNEKNKVWDIVSEDFTIVKNLNDKYIIKRHNCDSAHSGYIYKSEDLMYLFSTGTIYENEKQYSAFSAYVRKHFNDDFSEATKKIYGDGYGSRLVRPETDIKFELEDKEILQNIDFPIDIFPEPIQNYLLESNETLNSSIDYMGCSLLWLISVCIGNSMKIEVTNDWYENSTIWMSIVGKPGWGKTPSINRVIKPIQKINYREVQKYYKDLDKFEYYESLSKKDKEDHPEVFKPVNTQFIANDVTMEALVQLHSESDNAVGVFKDELAGWFKDMNKYRAGSDLEFWLSCWSSSQISITRISRRGAHIESPCIPVIGGIQPGVFSEFNNDQNKANGFMDRMLLCYPELKSEYLSEKKMRYDSVIWYNDRIAGFYDAIHAGVIERDNEGKIVPRVSAMTKEAFNVYNKRHKEITDIENDDYVNEYLKSMLPKQKAYIARFALLIHTFDNYFSGEHDALEVSVESVNKAIKLSDYFIDMAKRVKVDSSEALEIKNVMEQNKFKTKFEQFEYIFKANPNIDKKKSADQLGVSLKTIYKYINKIKEPK